VLTSTQGPVRAVVRAVPIAILKPMIGASEAVGQTLLGIHNTFESDARQQAEAKYKQR
jgi:autophagy-related protein 2